MNATDITTVVPCRPSPRPLRKSAKVSPTVVERILMIQNHSVTWGTLLSSVRPVACCTELVMGPPCECGTEHGLNAGGAVVRTPGPWLHVDGARVLLVEDDLPLRELVSRGLREAGLEVVTAGDGTTALRT